MSTTTPIVPSLVTPCEGERQVKQYHCTHLHSKLLGLKADGLLSVTNRRVIFHASGLSITGRSIIQSEIPIEDVSGISVFKGHYFSIKHLLFGMIINSVSYGVFTALMALLSFGDASSANVIRWIVGIGGFVGAIALAQGSHYQSIKALVSASLAASAFIVLAGSSILSGLLGGSNPYGYFGAPRRTTGSSFAILLVFATSILILILLVKYAKRLTMSLAIGSKGGASSPIVISGMSGLGLANSAAPKALESEPTAETDQMIKEIGALILDIQTLGDHGLEKWLS